MVVLRDTEVELCGPGLYKTLTAQALSHLCLSLALCVCLQGGDGVTGAVWVLGCIPYSQAFTFHSMGTVTHRHPALTLAPLGV